MHDLFVSEHNSKPLLMQSSEQESAELIVLCEEINILGSRSGFCKNVRTGSQAL